MSKRTCEVIDCAKGVHARGYCASHYVQLKKAGEIRPLQDRICGFCGEIFKPKRADSNCCSRRCSSRLSKSRVSKVCENPRCDGVQVARGLCSKHYQRSTKNLRPCKYEGCQNGGARIETGYCNTHHNRLKKHGDPSTTMKGKAHKVKYTDDGLRICTKCKTPKPDEDFHRDKGGTNGRRAACAECEVAIQQQRYWKDAERIKAHQRNYRLQNLELVRSQEAANYERNRAKRVASAIKNSHVRRARLAEVLSEPGVTLAALRQRDGDECCYCGVTMDFKSRKRGEGIAGNRATLEHIFPISRGGSHTFLNAALACHECNVSKGEKTVEEWNKWKAGESYGRKKTTTSSKGGQRFREGSTAVLF